MRRLILALSLLGLLLLPAAPAMAFDPYEKVCQEGGSGSSVCQDRSGQDPLSGRDKEGVIIKAARAIALLTGVASVIVIIIGGLQYILASGDPSKTNAAKNTLLYAVIGLVIALVAESIVRFVAGRF